MNVIDVLEEADREKLDPEATVQLLIDRLKITREEAEDIVDTANDGGDIVGE